MPRSQTKPSIMLMLSISATARALSVPLSFVHTCIDEGSLSLKQVGIRKLIPVSSIEELIRSFPPATRGPHG